MHRGPVPVLEAHGLNGKLRDELPNGEIFYTLKGAQVLIEQWRNHYNTIRPHSSLGYRPPAPQTIVPHRVDPPFAIGRATGRSTLARYRASSKLTSGTNRGGRSPARAAASACLRARRVARGALPWTTGTSSQPPVAPFYSAVDKCPFRDLIYSSVWMGSSEGTAGIFGDRSCQFYLFLTLNPSLQFSV